MPRSGFARGTIVLIGGTGGAQLVAIIASPVLTRLYTPDDFGVLAVYMALVITLGVISSLRYHLGILLPDDEIEAAAVTVLAASIVVVFALLAGVAILLYSEPIAEALNTPGLTPYLWVVPLGLLFLGAQQVFGTWAIREKAFTAIAGLRLFQSVFAVGIQLAASALGSIALLAGQASGQLVGAGYFLWIAVCRRWAVFRRVDLRSIGRAAIRYRRFAIYSSWGSLANKLSVQLPPILFAVMFSPALAGLYALTYRVCALPMSLIGRAVADVFFSRAARSVGTEQLPRLVKRSHSVLAAIAAPPTIVLVFIGPELFTFVFGDLWTEAGHFARWMAPYLFLQFVSSPLSSTFSVLEEQAMYAQFQVALAVSALVGLGLGYYLDSAIAAVIALSVFSALSYLAMAVTLFARVGLRWFDAIGPVIRESSIGIIFALPLGFLAGDRISTLLIGLTIFAGYCVFRYLAIAREINNEPANLAQSP